MTDLRKAAEMALEALERSMEAGMTGIKVDQSITALRQALEQPDPFSSLVRIMGTFDLSTGHADNWNDLLDSLESELRDVLGHYREALKVKQEPVAYRVWDRMGVISFRRTKPDESEYVEWDALYTAPPKREWVGLTGDEVNDLKHWLDHRAQWSYIEFARAIEAKLKEKNT